MALVTDMYQLLRQCFGRTGKTIKETCEECGQSVKAVGGILYKRRQGISAKMIELFDALGYDVEVNVVPKDREKAGEIRRCGYLEGFFLMRKESKAKEDDLLLASGGLSSKYSIGYMVTHIPFPLVRYLRCADVMGYDVLICKKGRPLNESVVVVDKRFVPKKSGK